MARRGADKQTFSIHSIPINKHHPCADCDCEGSLKRKLISPPTHPPFARTHPTVWRAACTSRAVQLIGRETCVDWNVSLAGKSNFGKVQSAKLTERETLEQCWGEKRDDVCMSRMQPFSGCLLCGCRVCVRLLLLVAREHAAGKMCVGINSTRPPPRSPRICRWEAFAAAADAFESKCVCLMHAAAHPPIHPPTRAQTTPAWCRHMHKF